MTTLFEFHEQVLTPEQFVASWLTVDDHSNGNTHPDLCKQISICRTWLNKLRITRDMSTLISLEHWLQTVYAKWVYIYAFDIMDEGFELNWFEGYKSGHNDEAAKIAELYEIINTLKFERTDQVEMWIRFYARCCDSIYGPTDCQRYRSCVEPDYAIIHKLHSPNYYNTVKYSRNCFNWHWEEQPELVWNHATKLLRDHIVSLREYFLSLCVQKDWLRVSNFLLDAHAKYAHIYLADIFEQDPFVFVYQPCVWYILNTTAKIIIPDNFRYNQQLYAFLDIPPYE